MLGPSLETKGGISAVIDSYRRAGLFARWPVLHLATHADKGAVRKLMLAVCAFMRFSLLLFAGRVALLHVHSASNASFWRKSVFVLAAKLARRPVIFHLHGGGFMDFVRCSGKWSRGYIRFVLDRVDELIVLSPVWLGHLAQVTANSRVRVIGNAVDDAGLLTVGSYRRRAHTILFMGRLNREKGIFDLLNVLREVRSKVPDTMVIFAGTGDSYALLAHAREEQVASQIELRGWVTGDAKVAAMAQASIYVLPSYIECMPMSLLEAMAAGLAVVASTTGGIPDIVENEVDGLLIAPGDRTALTSALLRLLNDDALRLRLGEAARRKVAQRYTVGTVLPQIEAIYEKLGARALKVVGAT